MFRNYFLGKSILLVIVSLSFIITSQIPAQKKENLEVKLSALQEGNKQIPENEWATVKFIKGNPVYVSFSLSSSTTRKIFYRVLLDSDIIEANLLENVIALKNMTEGIHILKITACTTDGTESEPLVLPLTIIDQSKIPAATEQKKAEQNSSSFINNPMFFYIIAGVCIIQLIVILILLFRPKSKPKTDNSSIITELQQSKEEYLELYNSHKRLKDELKDLKDYNDYLKKQKGELEATIKNLESVNVNLLDQKEKLVESKRQLELLHTQKEELFAMAIHDIKNPLSAMRGYIELLNSYELNATEQHEVMSSLVSSSENICKLTQSMCTIIAQERPEPTLKFAPTSMKKIIDDICNQNMSYAKAKSIKLFNKSSVGPARSGYGRG